MEMLACTVLEKKMRGDKNARDVELAKWFLERSGSIADVEGRAFVAKMAGVSGAAPNAGETPKQMLSSEARDLNFGVVVRSGSSNIPRTRDVPREGQGVRHF
jgi:hypothetical protein